MSTVPFLCFIFPFDYIRAPKIGQLVGSKWSLSATVLIKDYLKSFLNHEWQTRDGFKFLNVRICCFFLYFITVSCALVHWNRHFSWCLSDKLSRDCVRAATIGQLVWSKG